MAYRALTDSQCTRHISKLATLIQACSNAAQSALTNAGLICHDAKAEGKYLWVRHPQFNDSAALAEQLERMQISLAPGRIFRPDGLATPWFRLNVSSPVNSLIRALQTS
ncbi:MAG: hypothetical protein HC765_04810 [Brachymonas sp.]|nr:hypothetical protein [Brachymonas sp.]